MIIHNTTVEQTGAPLYKAKKALVMLHDRGDTARTFIHLSQQLRIDSQIYAVLAPQAIGNTWYPHGFMVPLQHNEPQLSLSLDAISELLDDLAAFGLKSQDIYLLGFSQGACLLLEFAARHARRYGGLVAFTGGLIGQQVDPSRYKGNFLGTPVFLGASERDPQVPRNRVDETEAILTGMGGRVIKRIYPGTAHSIHPDELKIADLLLNDMLNH